VRSSPVELVLAVSKHCEAAPSTRGLRKWELGVPLPPSAPEPQYPTAARQGGSQNHRTVWVGRDLQRPSSPTSCHGQEHLSLDQVAQSSCFTGWGERHRELSQMKAQLPVKALQGEGPGDEKRMAPPYQVIMETWTCHLLETGDRSSRLSLSRVKPGK